MIKEDLLSEITRQEKRKTELPGNAIDRLVRETSSRDLSDQEEIVDVIEYARAGWGLNENLFPVQRFLLKLVFGVPLDDRPDDIITDIISPTQFSCLKPDQFRKFRYLDIGDNYACHAEKVDTYRNIINLDHAPDYPLQLGDPVTARIEVWDQFREVIQGTYNESEFFDFLYGYGPGTETCRISLSRDEYNQRLGQQMNQVVFRIGRRGSKSAMAQIMASYFCYKILKKYNPQDYYQVKRDQAITMTLMATSKEQAQDLLAPARATIKRTPYLRRFVDQDSARRLILNTASNIDKGISSESGIRVTAIPCSARSARGPANILGVLEEFGFFYAHLEGSNQSDKEIYAALAPSTTDLCNPDTGDPEGLITILSTPLTTESYMYEIESSIWERKSDLTNSLVVWLPSYWTNPLLSSKRLKEIHALDPSFYNREYGAEYAEQLETALSRESLELCRQESGSKEQRFPGEEAYMGFDLALKKDATSISIVLMNGSADARLVYHEVIQFKKTANWEEYVDESTYASLDIRKIAKRVDKLWDYWGVKQGLGDQHESFGFRSHLLSGARDALELADMTLPKNDQIATNFLAYINQRKIVIYAPDTDWKVFGSLLRELSRLKKLMTGGMTPKCKLIAPNVSDAHDDQYSSISRALFVGQKDVLENPPSIGAVTRLEQKRMNQTRDRLEAMRAEKQMPRGPNRTVGPMGRRFHR
jgi:hypothetical protein